MKQPRRAQCSNCQRTFEPKLHRGWRVVAGASGLIVGSLVTENLFGGVLIGGLSYAAARLADSYYALRCPSCAGRGSWILEEVRERREEPERREERRAA